MQYQVAGRVIWPNGLLTKVAARLQEWYIKMATQHYKATGACIDVDTTLKYYFESSSF